MSARQLMRRRGGTRRTIIRSGTCSFVIGEDLPPDPEQLAADRAVHEAVSALAQALAAALTRDADPADGLGI